jgi:hypothetical protein
LPAEAVDATGSGLELGRAVGEDDGQVRRVRGSGEHAEGHRVRLPVAVGREQQAERFAQLERPLQVAACEFRPRRHEAPLTRPGR